MEERQLLRLQRVEVDGLFGIYDHRIDLDLKDRVTLLHGRNGVGKTAVLRMINALLRGEFTYFRRIPFARFFLTFEDSSSLELAPTGSNTRYDTATLTLATKDGKEVDDVELHSEGELLAEKTGFLEPHPGIEKTWIDVRHGEVLTEAEIRSRYGRFRSRHGRSGREYLHQEKISWLDEFLGNTNVHLIEAQRLVRTSFHEASRSDFDPGRVFSSFRHPILTTSVVECAKELKNRLDSTMAAYGRQAQTLDQTFPQRLMTAPESPTLDIQKRMKKLVERTENYKTIGILDETTAHPFNVDSLGTLDETRSSAMALYVLDTEQKLEVLDDLANPTRHFLDSVNDKFYHKKLRLDRKEGLVAQGEEDQNLPLQSLSSGEQHELVLHYELLFKIRPNTVVLIDEPEISLHVAWQKNFLLDLMEIIKISGFDAVVATHSPYIVGDRDDLMVGLGNPVEVV